MHRKESCVATRSLTGSARGGCRETNKGDPVPLPALSLTTQREGGGWRGGGGGKGHLPVSASVAYAASIQKSGIFWCDGLGC